MTSPTDTNQGEQQIKSQNNKPNVESPLPGKDAYDFSSELHAHFDKLTEQSEDGLTDGNARSPDHTQSNIQFHIDQNLLTEHNDDDLAISNIGNSPLLPDLSKQDEMFDDIAIQNDVLNMITRADSSLLDNDN